MTEKKFKISWTEESWFTTEIKATDSEQARDLFWDKLMSGGLSDAKPFGGEMQDSVEVEEIVKESI